MRSYLAILREAVREAMDAYVIYVLFALSLLLILITASLSFDPAPPADALSTIVKKFGVVFPDRGQGKVPIFTKGSEYKVVDVRDAGGGKYAFRLEAAPSDVDKLKDLITLTDSKTTDGLRISVVNWLKPAAKTRTIAFAPGMPAMQVAELQKVTAEELRAVTDAELEAFIKHQFEIQGGFSDVTATRVTTDVKEPAYAFDVTVSAKSGVR